METVYKLTDKDGKTRPGKYNEKQWGENVTHTDRGAEELCGPGWLHAYTNPLLAVLLNKAHAAFDKDTMLLWKCEAEVGMRRADKIGCTKLTTVRKIPLPVFTAVQYRAFAILAAKEVYKDSKFQLWADNWLSGKDRSSPAANAATNAAAAVARDAAEAGWATRWVAANAAAFAANAAAFAAAAVAGDAGLATLWVAANAATNAAAAHDKLDLVKIAELALIYK